MTVAKEAWAAAFEARARLGERLSHPMLEWGVDLAEDEREHLFHEDMGDMVDLDTPGPMQWKDCGLKHRTRWLIPSLCLGAALDIIGDETGEPFAQNLVPTKALGTAAPCQECIKAWWDYMQKEREDG